MPDNENIPVPDASVIRPERSYIEVPIEESRNLAFPAFAAISGLSGLFALFSLAILTAVFSPIPLMQIIFYALGILAGAIAATTGITAIIRLRKSIIPRGKFSAWLGLVLGVGVLAVAINALAPILAHGCEKSISCIDGQYFIDRPEGWVVIPDNTFDITSDAEMVKLDGTGFAMINRLNKKSDMAGLASFLAYVYKTPYAVGHSHNHDASAADATKYNFQPASILIVNGHRKELQALIKVEIAGLKKTIVAKEKKKQKRIIADSLARNKKRLASLEQITQPVDILKYFVIKTLGAELGEKYPRLTLGESTATTPDGSPIVEVTFKGVSNKGNTAAALAMLWFTEKKRFQIITFTENAENLPVLRNDMLRAIAGFRIAGE